MKKGLLLLLLVAAVCMAAYHPGDTEVPVQITMDNQMPVKGVQFTLCDMPDWMWLSSRLAEPSSRTTGFIVDSNEVGHCARVLIYSTSGALIAPGTGAILTLYYDVTTSATAGDVALQLGEYIVADVNNAPLPVNPIDGILTVVPTPSPTPTPTPTPTATPTPTPTATPTATPTPTPTPMPPVILGLMTE